MSTYQSSLYNIWILTNLLKVKSYYYFNRLINGNTNEVERIIENNNGLVTNIYQHFTNLVSEPSHIIDNIYLGSAFNVSSLETLQQYEIKKILNVTREIPCLYPDQFTYKTISVKDTRDSFLDNYLENSYQYLTQDVTVPTLVHCYMGSSRSATIVIFYLMKRYLMTFSDALQFVRDKRKCVNLNTNFAEELQKFQF